MSLKDYSKPNNAVENGRGIYIFFMHFTIPWIKKHKFL